MDEIEHVIRNTSECPKETPDEMLSRWKESYSFLDLTYHSTEMLFDVLETIEQEQMYAGEYDFMILDKLRSYIGSVLIYRRENNES